MSKEKLIPDLRFPQFKNEGKWVEKRISELGETINGLTGKSGEDFGAGSPFVTYKQVFDKSSIDFEKCGKVQVSENDNQNTLGLGDILFTTSSETPNEVGFASVLIKAPKEATYLNSFCFALRPFNIEETQPQFSQYLFHSPIYRKSVTTIAQGSTRYNISKGAFLNLKLPIPKPQEQQKIASCLSSLDEVIAAHRQKLDLLKDHKKGLMQNLFPQLSESRYTGLEDNRMNDEEFKNKTNEILKSQNQKNPDSDNIPKYRFKEFEKDGDWEEKKLGDLIELLSGYPFQSQYFSDEGQKLIIPKNFTKDGYASFSIENTKYTTEVVDSKYWCKEGDLLLLLTDLTPSCELLGKPVLLKEKDGQVLLNQRIVKVIHRKGVFSDFLLQFFLTEKYHFRIKSTASGSTVKHSSNKIILETEISVPKNPNEQQKIASCLSSLDALITAQVEKIEQLKLHKKGLIQGLFPKIKE